MSLARYSRQFILPELGMRGQQKLSQAKVLCIGAGGLGAPVIAYLAAAGVGHIGIADGDTVELSNLQRQVLFKETDVGQNKAVCAAKFVHQLNKNVEAKAFNSFITKDNVFSVLADFDLIIDGSDNFGCRYLINDACVILNKPFISASIEGFEGQLGIFNDGDEGATYRCVFPEAPASQHAPTCSQIGVIGPIAGVLGGMQALEAIKWIGEIDGILRNQLLIYNALQHRQLLLDITPNLEYKSIRELKGKEYQPTEVEMKNDNNLVIPIKAFDQKGVVLDIRSKEEREAYSIGGLHIPLENLSDNIHQLSDIKGIIQIICTSGARSLEAVDSLQKLGLHNAKAVEGGLGAYIQWKLMR
ncbi:MAG: HesA/MoeB/ThiF family protein [Cyclobacteriaceae bacterium]|nr:HesA/MoeB/ThiF family protein [Cyclobacteriaceae bacterium]MCH8517028.1 HesA/MoeB/ThiF family protein [Cyclobacteriaceae bacterium]